jgi:cell division protein FtsZ
MEVEPRVVASHPALPPANAVSEYAKQPQPRRIGEAAAAAGGLDSRGRMIPADAGRDDHLEIPAFLRRQSS